jgi:hypothetical protein
MAATLLGQLAGRTTGPWRAAARKLATRRLPQGTQMRAKAQAETAARIPRTLKDISHPRAA